MTHASYMEGVTSEADMLPPLGSAALMFPARGIALARESVRGFCRRDA